MKLFYLFFILLIINNLSAQDNRLTILGKIKNKNLPVVNAHIINKNSKKGSLSNSTGKFQISVKVNDTLIFSNIQFKTKVIVINHNHVKNKSIDVNMDLKTNELKEVVVEQHENMAKALGLPNADKKPLNKLERNLNHYSQAPTPIVILGALLGQRGGIDDIYNIISGNRKRDRKLKNLLDADKKQEIDQEYVRKIRAYFTDDFFINTIDIQEKRINEFLTFCFNENTIFLFNKERYMEIIDVLLQNKSKFLDSSE